MTRQHWKWLLVLMAAELISGFETSMILASLTAWQRELGDPVKVGWLVSSYLLVAAVASAHEPIQPQELAAQMQLHLVGAPIHLRRVPRPGADPRSVDQDECRAALATGDDHAQDNACQNSFHLSLVDSP